MQFKSKLSISQTSALPCYFWLFSFLMKNPALSPLFQPANQPPCDVTVLQQIEEETCGDGNPWTLTRGQSQIAGTLGMDILSFTTLENRLIRYMFVGKGGGSSTCDWEGALGKQCCAFMCFMICLSITAVQSVWVQHAAELFNDF